MNPALAIVILVVVLLVTGVVFGVRAFRRMDQASATYVHELAPRLGASVERDSPARLTGERDGRRFIISLRRPHSERAQVVETWIEVAVSTAMDLQVQPQTSDAGARIAGDQSLGDPVFDAACFVRTTDLDLVRRALDQELRTMITDALDRREFRLLVVHKQWLRFELRGATDEPGNEPMITRFLQAALTLAGRLDAGTAALR